MKRIIRKSLSKISSYSPNGITGTVITVLTYRLLNETVLGHFSFCHRALWVSFSTDWFVTDPSNTLSNYIYWKLNTHTVNISLENLNFSLPTEVWDFPFSISTPMTLILQDLCNYKPTLREEQPLNIFSKVTIKSNVLVLFSNFKIQTYAKLPLAGWPLLRKGTLGVFFQ